MAEELGIEAKRVNNVLGDRQPQITLDIVDRALMNASALVRVGGRLVTTLDDLYPPDTWLAHQAG